jgi:hypothetical protein
MGIYGKKMGHPPVNGTFNGKISEVLMGMSKSHV